MKNADLNYKSITEKVIELTVYVVQFTDYLGVNFSLSNAETKSKNNFVSYVDKETEKLLIEKLSVLIPEAGFITEEGIGKENGEDFVGLLTFWMGLAILFIVQLLMQSVWN